MARSQSRVKLFQALETDRKRKVIPPPTKKQHECLMHASAKAKAEHSLELAVTDYEASSGFQAIHYRTCPRKTSFRIKLEMVTLDLYWFERQTTEIENRLKRAISDGVIAS